MSGTLSSREGRPCEIAGLQFKNAIGLAAGLDKDGWLSRFLVLALVILKLAQ